MYFGIAIASSKVAHREPSAMEDSRRIHKFLESPYEDFQLWIDRTEAAMQNKGVLRVVVNDPVGETDIETLSAEVTHAIAQARSIIILYRDWGIDHFEFVCQKLKILIECGYV